MCFIDNIVEANILAMKYKKKLNGEVFNIAHSKPISINEIWRIIEKLTGKKLNLEKRPRRIGDVRFTRADISKARRMLGFKPDTDFEKCLKKTIQWFEERRNS